MSNIDNSNNTNSYEQNNLFNEEFLVPVFKTDNMAIIAVIKSILDEAGIKYLAKGDKFQGVLPVNAFPVEFQVMPEDVEYAKELLKDIDEVSDWYDDNFSDDDNIDPEDLQNPEN